MKQLFLLLMMRGSLKKMWKQVWWLLQEKSLQDRELLLPWWATTQGYSRGLFSEWNLPVLQALLLSKQHTAW